MCLFKQHFASTQKCIVYTNTSLLDYCSQGISYLPQFLFLFFIFLFFVEHPVVWAELKCNIKPFHYVW